MGTSTNYQGPPTWGPVKAAVTSSIDGGVAPTGDDLAKVIGTFVETVAGETGRGTFGPPLATSFETTPISGTASSGTGAKGSTASGSGSRSGGSGGAGGGTGGGRRSSHVGPRYAAASLASFLGSVSKNGFQEACRSVGLDNVAGMTPEELAIALANALCEGQATTFDEVEVQNALSSMLMELLATAQAGQIEGILQNAFGNIETVLASFFGHFILERFASVNAAGLNKTDLVQPQTYVDQVKDFIRTAVSELQIAKPLATVDWTSAEGAAEIDRIVDATTAVFIQEE